VNDFVFIIMANESCEGGYIHSIHTTKQLALTELKELAKHYNKEIIKEQFQVGVTVYDIEEYEVFKEKEGVEK
jgi:hypothetical protein